MRSLGCEIIVMFVIAKVTFKFYVVQIINSAEVNNANRCGGLNAGILVFVIPLNVHLSS
jgi:hypothetical protein